MQRQLGQGQRLGRDASFGEDADLERHEQQRENEGATFQHGDREIIQPLPEHPCCAEEGECRNAIAIEDPLRP